MPLWIVGQVDGADQNGIELYWDRPQAEWPLTREGELAMVTQPLDLDDLLAQAP